MASHLLNRQFTVNAPNHVWQRISPIYHGNRAMFHKSMMINLFLKIYRQKAVI